MKLWHLTAAAALSAGLLAAPAAAQAAPASYACGSGTVFLADVYGEVAGNGAVASLVADGHGDSFCVTNNSEGGNWQNLVDTSFYSGYLTWNSRTGGLYITTVSYPASQAWGWHQVPSGSYELVNDYADACLAGETVGDDLYMYTCLKNGANSLDWTPAS
jgi:hypothetical protein